MYSSLLLLCFLIGCVAGLRSMMAPAIICATAYVQWIHLEKTPLAFLDTIAALSIFTLFAIGELIVDKLPKTPARTAPVGLIARIITGGLCGAALAMSAGKGVPVGILLGSLGGITGAFVGYNVRHGLVTHMNLPDFVVAVVEDLLAISGGLFVVSKM
ncbi:DUF4126 family protein [Edaphobacter albus]|uniref:DUF4126 family protein n=1 Tax=Edaphobacter sp. 4G125 TaxID=2763071 RepID=UPI001647366D|nr:DUF4126 family protein [Edaphobacter sp. 4G125]QNI36970.1 DUF4126 family protein [Edaphobacter sp. 4G125]